MPPDEPDAPGLADRLFGWARRSAGDGGRAGESGGETVPTKALARFLAALSAREAPVVLDLGPVVGPNVAFLGDRLGCKLLVEDLYAEIDRLTREGRLAEFRAFLETRLAHPPGSVDGVLCWDLVDFLDKPAAQGLGAQLTRMLKPGGAILGFFATGSPQAAQASRYTKYQIVDDKTLLRRFYPGLRPRQPSLTNREVGRLFEGLRVAESFLLLARTREMLFRKAG